MGAITAYAGLMAKRTGYKALYLSGGGVAANSLGMPDLGISTMEDVLTDARRIVDATGMPLLVDIDTGWGGAFNIGRTIKNFQRVGVAAVHMEDQVGQKRCGHRPGKEVVSMQEMVDRVKSAVDARTDGVPRFVAGAVGPTNKTLSLSPDVEDPGFREVTFDEIVAVYVDQCRALVEGGADFILIETVFDTLNCKAAIMAVKQLERELGRDLPLMISLTLTDLSGRNLSGHTVEAFWYTVRHAKPLTIGLNCSFGAEQLRPHVQLLSDIADTYLMAYPNAGLPNDLGEYDELPETTAALTRVWAENGRVNALGGCCGSTPAHIAAMAAAVEGLAPRIPPRVKPDMRLAGLEPFSVAA